MFISSKYTKIYNSIISLAKKRNRGDEMHHIIPRSCGGSDTEDNLVFLTYREHFIVHRILAKIMKYPEHKIKMLQAVYLMATRQSNFSSTTYAILKDVYSTYMKENNPMFNKAVVKKRLSNITHDQSKVCRIRNNIYWSDPSNKKKLSDRNRQRTLLRGPKYTVSNTNTSKDFHTLSEISEYINEPIPTIYKYLTTGKKFLSGWCVSLFGNKDG